jgi:hypothetical protein
MTNIYRNYQDPNEFSSLNKKVQTKGTAPIVHKAIVIDVILDPFNLTPEQIKAIKGVTQKNSHSTSLAEMMPVNTVIGKIVSNNGGNDAQPHMIIMPWFSSHILMPVKPGEIVNVIYDDFEGTGAQMPFWVSRRHSPGSVEDVNYTHHDRIYDATHNPENYGLVEREKTSNNNSVPGFPNGGGTPRSQTIESDDIQDSYEKIINESSAYPLHTPEPVPRFKKKPGDLTLQGSNNTLINLGEDRNGTIDDEDNIRKFAGTIDIVAGRGRIIPTSADENPEGTAPRVVENSRGDLETDKAPFQRGFDTNKNNPNEGDPDFINDAARLYVTMQTEADRKFALILNNTQLPDLESIDGTINRSHVVGKADHIRFIARNSEDPNIKGTVLLIREGQPNQDLGYFYINEEGHIFIEAEKIYKGEASGETEPSILFTNYEQTILALQKQIDTLTEKVETAFRDALGNLGSPIPSMQPIGVSQQITNANSSNKKLVEDNTKTDQHSLKSFNEPNSNR